MKRQLLSIAVVTVVVAAATPAPAFDPLQRAERAARDAQRALAAGDTTAAIESMRLAQALAPDDPRIRAGLGETLYDGGEYEAALRQFEPLADPQAPLPQRRRALYNAGNAAFEQQDFERALDYYTQAVLEGDGPASDDLLHNLELAQRLMQQQQQQSQQSDESGDEGEPQDGDEQSEQEQQPQEGDQSPPEDQEPPEQEQQQQQEQAPPDSTAQQPPPPDQPQDAPADSMQAPPPDLEQMTPEEAMRLLEALDFDEQQLRESIQRRLRGDEQEDEHDW